MLFGCWADTEEISMPWWRFAVQLIEGRNKFKTLNDLSLTSLFTVLAELPSEVIGSRGGLPASGSDDLFDVMGPSQYKVAMTGFN